MHQSAGQWAVSAALAGLTWFVAIASLAAASLMPVQYRMGALVAATVLTLAVVLVIGVRVADHWWTRGASLTAAPLLLIGLWMAFEAYRSQADANYHGYAVYFTILALAAGAVVGVAVMASAGLGVIIGQQRREQ